MRPSPPLPHPGVPRGCAWGGDLGRLDELVVLEDNHLLALFKPGGVLAQADRSQDVCLLGALKEHLIRKYSKPGDAFVGLVHRLDRPSSGVMLFGKTSKGSARLCEAFRERKVLKKYLVVVEGVIERDEQLQDYLLMHKSPNETLVSPVASSDTVEGILSYRVLRNLNGSSLSLLDVSLTTGRKHQIRSQLAHRGHPVVGDLKYGSKRKFVNRYIALHAYLMSFHHPVSHKQIILTCPPPLCWTETFGESPESDFNKAVDDFCNGHNKGSFEAHHFLRRAKTK